MDRRRVLNVVALLLVVALAGVALVAAGVVQPPVSAPPDDSYEWTAVTVTDEDGTRLGQVDVRIADTGTKRYTGLSNTTSMPEDEGMLFVYERERDLTYVMREMDFGLDIVYIDSEGVITSIHHAPKPPEGADGNDFRYSGTGQYVLEVNLDWTTRHGVEVGDRIAIGEAGVAVDDTSSTADTATSHACGSD